MPSDARRTWRQRSGFKARSSAIESMTRAIAPSRTRHAAGLRKSGRRSAAPKPSPKASRQSVAPEKGKVFHLHALRSTTGPGATRGNDRNSAASSGGHKRRLASEIVDAIDDPVDPIQNDLLDIALRDEAIFLTHNDRVRDAGDAFGHKLYLLTTIVADERVKLPINIARIGSIAVNKRKRTDSRSGKCLNAPAANPAHTGDKHMCRLEPRKPVFTIETSHSNPISIGFQHAKTPH